MPLRGGTGIMGIGYWEEGRRSISSIWSKLIIERAERAASGRDSGFGLPDSGLRIGSKEIKNMPTPQ